MGPHQVCPSSPTTYWHHTSYTLRPCKGPISIPSHSHTTPLSLPLCPPRLPLARFLAWSSPIPHWSAQVSLGPPIPT
jgi:hypothetical protein